MSGVVRVLVEFASEGATAYANGWLRTEDMDDDAIIEGMVRHMTEQALAEYRRRCRDCEVGSVPHGT